MSKSIGISPSVMKEKKLRAIDTNTSLQRRFNFGGKSDKQKVNTINLVNFGNVVLPSETRKKSLKQLIINKIENNEIKKYEKKNNNNIVYIYYLNI